MDFHVILGGFPSSKHLFSEWEFFRNSLPVEPAALGIFQVELGNAAWQGKGLCLFLNHAVGSFFLWFDFPMISKQLEWDYTYFLFVLLMAYFVLSLEKPNLFEYQVFFWRMVYTLEHRENKLRHPPAKVNMKETISRNFVRVCLGSRYLCVYRMMSWNADLPIVTICIS